MKEEVYFLGGRGGVGSDQLLRRSVQGNAWECKWKCVSRVPRPRWDAAMAILKLGIENGLSDRAIRRKLH